MTNEQVDQPAEKFAREFLDSLLEGLTSWGLRDRVLEVRLEDHFPATALIVVYRGRGKPPDKRGLRYDLFDVKDENGVQLSFERLRSEYRLYEQPSYLAAELIVMLDEEFATNSFSANEADTNGIRWVTVD